MGSATHSSLSNRFRISSTVVACGNVGERCSSDLLDRSRLCRSCAPTSSVKGGLGRAVDAILRKESPASAGPPFQVVRRSTALGRNRFALLDSCLGCSRLRWRYRCTLLLRPIRGLMLLTRQFCGAQFPRPIAELVAHDGLLSVAMPACPLRLLRIVVPCYARIWSDVHTVSGVKQRVNSTPRVDERKNDSDSVMCALAKRL